MTGQAIASTAAGAAGVPAGHGQRAAEHASRRTSVSVSVPVVGTVRLPSTEELGFLAGVGVLAAVGVLEWPIAGVLAAGHVLVANKRNRVLHDFGEALEEA